MNFKSNGKILLTAEYAVLDGAKALALPTKFGQSMEVSLSGSPGIIQWKSLDANGNTWFETRMQISENGILSAAHSADKEEKKLVERLEQILNHCFDKKPGFFHGKGFTITTRLDFDRSWGLGTSSTLINNLAQWLEIDAFDLLANTFGGSGYDLAAAANDQPITYQLGTGKPAVFKADFNPPFQDELFFVYLNRKQNSRQAIARYKAQESEIQKLVEKISGLTEQIMQCEDLPTFELLLNTHEALISQAIALPQVKNELFPDFPGSIKSLGGWGGDFVLATGNEQAENYFRNKNYHTIFRYQDLIL
ncbi:GYDIA family GHMP kinase [Christiangramia flava]|uniref:Uncharacterized protein n=1 Tax=Christiangramia flava JLT2011 TaxID=1229726 RepID=A0A1L7I3H7_9FLAO|nr:GYDIA family GHMP kinase [Christiangramia flava]APU67733.1 hypothetical protein GRFL_1009 [Christiangramia flava JLT2011]OSS40237.1 hypothetical protein C723_0545 [Christiangramia flava JLT2011]